MYRIFYLLKGDYRVWGGLRCVYEAYPRGWRMAYSLVSGSSVGYRPCDVMLIGKTCELIGYAANFV